MLPSKTARRVDMTAGDRIGDASRASPDGAGQRGAEEQLTELMTEHERPLYAFLYSVLTDRSSVQDCLQDTYMRAYECLRTGGEVQTAWLYRVGYNRAMDELRRRSRVAREGVEVSELGDNVDRHLVVEEALSC